MEGKLVYIYLTHRLISTESGYGKCLFNRLTEW